MPNLIPTQGTPFSFTKDGKFLDRQVSAGITISASPAAALQLASNKPFPVGTTRVGNLSATVSGQSGDLKFGDGQDTVTFSGSASATSALAVYGNTQDLIKDLDPSPQKKILEGLKIDGTGATQFVLLDWGYNISEMAKGSVALGAGAKATFSADGSTDGLFAVIRSFATPPPSKEAVQSTVTSWMLPGQVDSVDDLEPGTWLIAEVDGSIAVKIGAQYGYSYSWIRNVDLSGLSGDVGLKIQAAVDAAVGFNASGKYLVVVARESLDLASKVIRVRIFKMAKKGWDFAFNASVGVTPSTGTLLPSQIDGFLAAVFGVHGAQIVEDLKLFDKWTDPNTPLPEILAGFVSDFVTRELGNFAGTEILKFQEARRRVADLLDKWENLGHSTSTLLWAEIQKAGGPVTELLNFLKQTNGLDDAGLKTLVETELGKAGFGSSLIGKWLESVTANETLTLLNSAPLLGKARTAAQTVLDIADGKVLDNLVKFVDQKLHIPDVEKIVSEADFNNLDPWLKSKLAKFIGKDTAVFEDLDKIRASAKAIRDKASDLYAQAMKALNNTYSAAFHYIYASTTTSTALVDVNFDFVKDPGVGAFMKMAIQGDFKDLLLASSPGVVLKSATLTHGVKRQSHVQVVLPYFSGTLDHINNSLAAMNVVEDKGRLFVYDVHAEDTVIRAHKWVGNLTITGKVSTGAGVRTFVTDEEIAGSMTFSYGLRQSLKNVRDVQFENQLEPLVVPYFPKAFGSDAAPDKASLHEWIGHLDDHASALGNTVKGDLGNVLLSLDVSLPGSVVAAWFNAPDAKKADAYLQMSRNIQRAMRRFAQFCYFGDLARYGDIAAAPAVFVYGCLPVSTNVRVNGNAIELDRTNDVYWDFEDKNTRQMMAFASRDALEVRMTGIADLLNDSEEFNRNAEFYDIQSDPQLVDQAIQAALANPAFHGLLFMEAETINHAREAGVKLAQFRANAGTGPQEAIAALEEFGAKVTEAFNHGLGGLVPRLEEFSAMIFLEAARAFDPDLMNIQPIARLDTILLKPSAAASVADAFLAGTAPDTTAITIEQPVVGLPG
jgi:hypothetical protein